MKKILTLTIVMIIMSAGLWAHAASAVTAGYNPATKLLTLSFEHSVRDAADHFISKAVIKVNNVDTITHMIRVQDSAAGGALTYKLPGLRSGDRVSVMVECNKGGRKSTQITIQ